MDLDKLQRLLWQLGQGTVSQKPRKAVIHLFRQAVQEQLTMGLKSLQNNNVSGIQIANGNVVACTFIYAPDKGSITIVKKTPNRTISKVFPFQEHWELSVLMMTRRTERFPSSNLIRMLLLGRIPF